MPVTLRPVCADDEAFLFTLYCSVRADEMAVWGWGTAQREAFLHMQFRAQRQHYQTLGVAADQCIICRDERPIGWIATINDDQTVWLADIALLPEQRNSGIGTALIGDMLAAATKAGRVVQLHVLHSNRALGLYQRLGFRIIADDGLHYHMEWRSSAEPGDSSPQL
jgi:ribosomal protein S18 acetylase RimI-like enzyme